MSRRELARPRGGLVLPAARLKAHSGTLSGTSDMARLEAWDVKPFRISVSVRGRGPQLITRSQTMRRGKN
jgi:hypothetical protein